MERPIYSEIAYNADLFDIATIDIVEAEKTNYRTFPERVIKPTWISRLFGAQDIIMVEGAYYQQSAIEPTGYSLYDLTCNEMVIDNIVYRKPKLSIKLINKKTDAIIERSMSFNSYEETIKYRKYLMELSNNMVNLDKKANVTI